MSEEENPIEEKKPMEKKDIDIKIRCLNYEEKIRESYESGILSMVKSNNRITRKEMAENLSISLRSLQRIINAMDELHYVGSGNHGHWEIRHDQY